MKMAAKRIFGLHDILEADIAPGEVGIVANAAECDRTRLMINACNNARRKGESALMVSDCSKESLVGEMTSIAYNIPPWHIEKGRLRPDVPNDLRMRVEYCKSRALRRAFIVASTGIWDDSFELKAKVGRAGVICMDALPPGCRGADKGVSLNMLSAIARQYNVAVWAAPELGDIDVGPLSVPLVSTVIRAKSGNYGVDFDICRVGGRRASRHRLLHIGESGRLWSSMAEKKRIEARIAHGDLSSLVSS